MDRYNEGAWYGWYQVLLGMFCAFDYNIVIGDNIFAILTEKLPV
jgi:hypothetical protein